MVRSSAPLGLLDLDHALWPDLVDGICDQTADPRGRCGPTRWPRARCRSGPSPAVTAHGGSRSRVEAALQTALDPDGARADHHVAHPLAEDLVGEQRAPLALQQDAACLRTERGPHGLGHRVRASKQLGPRLISEQRPPVPPLDAKWGCEMISLRRHCPDQVVGVTGLSSSLSAPEGSLSHLATSDEHSASQSDSPTGPKVPWRVGAVSWPPSVPGERVRGTSRAPPLRPPGACLVPRRGGWRQGSR
jgi:hypothetical protein